VLQDILERPRSRAVEPPQAGPEPPAAAEPPHLHGALAAEAGATGGSRRWQQQPWQHRRRAGGAPSPPDPRLARLAKELVQGIPKGAAHMRSLMLEADLSNAEARQLLSCLGKCDAPDVALAVFR
jgi:hypothetical protein